MSDDPYVYPETGILRNRLGLRTEAALDRAERRLVALRTREAIPTGRFDLKHLRAIHWHLFQDIFDWAGELRTVEIAKSGNQFQFCRYIETGIADVHRRIAAASFLRGLPAADFADRAAPIVGDVNYAHPFREGNGRTQLHYLRQLAEQAGHFLDLTKVDGAAWLHASKEAHFARYDAMAGVVVAAIRPRPEG